jgi:hypothetical protein
MYGDAIRNSTHSNNQGDDSYRNLRVPYTVQFLAHSWSRDPKCQLPRVGASRSRDLKHKLPRVGALGITSFVAKGRVLLLVPSALDLGFSRLIST